MSFLLGPFDNISQNQSYYDCKNQWSADDFAVCTEKASTLVSENPMLSHHASVVELLNFPKKCIIFMEIQCYFISLLVTSLLAKVSTLVVMKFSSFDFFVRSHHAKARSCCLFILLARLPLNWCESKAFCRSKDALSFPDSVYA